MEYNIDSPPNYEFFISKVYVFSTHGLFSGPCAQILLESPNLEKVKMTKPVNMKDDRICYAAGGDQLLAPGQEPDQPGQQDGGGGHIRDGV